MLYGFLMTLFVILCLLLVLIILIQKGKGSIGIGGLGGGAQMLFGGSGGQDLFQKVTWVMVALFMAGSLVLSLLKSSERAGGLSHYSRKVTTAPAPVSQPAAPSAPSAPETPAA